MTKNNPIHGAKPKRWFERKLLVEAGGSVPPLLGGGVGVALASSNEARWVLGLSLFWLAGFQVLKIWLANQADKKEEEDRGHDGLKAALYVLNAVVCHAWQQEGASHLKLRSTFHRVIPTLGDAAEQLEQVVPYVGGNGGGAHRKFPIRSGITGQAGRTGEIQVMERESSSEEAYRAELVSKWHYTKGDVAAISTERYSAIAIPVTDRDGQHVIGVVYLDSSEKNCFSSEQMQLAIIEGCNGIANYVGVRYG